MSNKPSKEKTTRFTRRKASTQRQAAGSTPKPKRQKKATPAARQGSNTATLMALLERPNGATLAELMQASGWQPHSVRGFLSGALARRWTAPSPPSNAPMASASTRSKASQASPSKYSALLAHVDKNGNPGKIPSSFHGHLAGPQSESPNPLPELWKRTAAASFRARSHRSPLSNAL